MTTEFKSLRKKLVIKLSLTYLAALLFVFALIIIKHTIDFNASITEKTSRLQASLTNKGLQLVRNNSIALTGLVEDNAFGAVQQMVSSTVDNNDDILYGIYSDSDQNDWGYAFRQDQQHELKSLADKNSVWASEQRSAAFISFHLEPWQLIEFAAPIFIDGEAQGVIRYALSTTELTETITSANQQASLSLMQTLVALVVIGAITLIVVFWRTDRVAKNITIPLNLLTNAANIISKGRYDHFISIHTNDEIGILANNFNVMTAKIQRTIANLAQINQLGGELAATRSIVGVYNKVLNGVAHQLEFDLALLYQWNENQELVPLAASKGSDNLVKQVTDQLASTPEINNLLTHCTENFTSQSIDIDMIFQQQRYRQLVVMPFSKRDDLPLFITLLATDKAKTIAESDREYSLSLSHLLVTSLENIEMNELLEEQNKDLEKKVAQRTEELHKQNQALSQALIELEQAQSQLIESEKMASLGSLVAGISHEINTPLGVAVTAASHLSQHTGEFKKTFDAGKLTKSAFTLYMDTTTESTHMILSNLEKAATLIQSFKQIAADQSSDNKTRFNVKEHLQMLITSLRPSYKHQPITIDLSGSEVEISSYPGQFSQVFSNLIINSISHGLANSAHGQINIAITDENDAVTITLDDNGIGIADDIKSKVFEPFFTTNRGAGNSGLGLNIVYNLVKQKLAGDICLEDNRPHGVRFVITMPKG